MSASNLEEANKVELILYENHYQNQVDEMKKQNVQLLELNTTQKARTTKTQACKTVHLQPTKDCDKLEKELEQCYHVNQTFPLKCSLEAKSFINCLNSLKSQC